MILYFLFIKIYLISWKISFYFKNSYQSLKNALFFISSKILESTTLQHLQFILYINPK